MSIFGKYFKKNTSLEKPFRLEKLEKLDFGNADGARDQLLEKVFVKTSSVKSFLTNKHSIISGPIGSGKSTLFRLLKEESHELSYFSTFLIVSIEETISFKMMKSFIDEHFSQYDNSLIYQLIWKFQIIIKLCEKLSNENNFPSNNDEKEINDFLKLIDSSRKQLNLIDRFRYLIDNYRLKLDATVLHFPISSEFSVSKNEINKELKLNLDNILTYCINSLAKRNKKALLIVDKIDRFVAGEEYYIQRLYIEGLLSIEDDLAPIENIHFKIFIRSDLFARLNFTGLGYDKVNDNTLKLKWSDDEIICFIANRIHVALKEVGLIESKDILLTTNLSEYHLTGLYVLRTVPNLFPTFIYKKIFKPNIINKERSTGLITYLNKAIITKIFPRNIQHRTSNGSMEFIDVFKFINTHFKDGHNATTPRHLLIFLKETQRHVLDYYSNNPDQTADPVNINGNIEWTLLKEGCVYKAYTAAKLIYVKNIGNADDKWTRYFVVFQSKRRKKTKFDFNWFCSILPEISHDEILNFISFMHVVGYLRIANHHVDIKKRSYVLPILYL